MGGFNGGAMSDIFLSYNREDQSRARLFAEAFAAAELSVWWDVTLRSGEAYDEVTEAASWFENPAMLETKSAQRSIHRADNDGRGVVGIKRGGAG